MQCCQISRKSGFPYFKNNLKNQFLRLKSFLNFKSHGHNFPNTNKFRCCKGFQRISIYYATTTPSTTDAVNDVATAEKRTDSRAPFRRVTPIGTLRRGQPKGRGKALPAGLLSRQEGHAALRHEAGRLLALDYLITSCHLAVIQH